MGCGFDNCCPDVVSANGLVANSLNQHRKPLLLHGWPRSNLEGISDPGTLSQEVFFSAALTTGSLSLAPTPVV